jgi:hypothetical protein
MQTCLVALCAMAAWAGLAVGQPFPTNAAKPGDALYQEMAAFDTRLFEAFNSCKLDVFAGLFDENVEFYHDQGGATLGVASVTEQVKANICGKARRELVAGSLQVYPMHGFGALIVGRHRFYQTSRGSEPTGVAQFVHLVRKVGDTWKLVRVISFDHVGLGPKKQSPSP